MTWELWQSEDGAEVSLFPEESGNIEETRRLLTTTVYDEPMILLAKFEAQDMKAAKRISDAILGL